LPPGTPWLRCWKVRYGDVGSWKAVYLEVIRIKHKRSALASGRHVSRDDVMGALVEIESLLKAKRDRIRRNYATV
jgi:hypothetical protein